MFSVSKNDPFPFANAVLREKNDSQGGEPMQNPNTFNVIHQEHPESGHSLSRVVLVTQLVLCGMMTFFLVPAHAQVDCTHLSHWSATQPPVNQTHIFCGEWSHNQPKGFHSRPGGHSPATVANFVVTQASNAKGVYGGRWHYAGHPNPQKNSTMYPDSCTEAQVLASIDYAVQHRVAHCPAGAPGWAHCGLNAPTTGGAAYCEATDHTNFTIAFALLNNGNVNTAFPLR
jgi:hypothetical protein